MLLAVILFFTLGECRNEDNIIYSNSWAVEVLGGIDVADGIANRHGFVNNGQIGNFANIYHFTHIFSPTQVRKRSVDKYHHLKAETQIRYVEQQVVKQRYKRDAYSPPSSRSWNKQWYLHRSSGHDMNVEKVWQQNITGRGAVISILDDGLEYTHPDLQANYDSLASYDFNDNDADPFPRYDVTNENKHGTRCAGEVVGIKGGQCGVGAAFDAKIGGVRMLDGDVTDIVEASSLSLKLQYIDIYSSSWGPNDDGLTVDGPGILATKAFLDGVTNGRNGLGSIYVWAAGNGGRYGDSCNCDGYAVSPLTVSVGSASERDNRPWYLEQCSSTLTSTYSSGGGNEKQIVTTDLHHRCTDRHTGTSASAPLAAGMIALALEVNPGLTWRDIQYLMVYSSNPQYSHDENWVTNGAGLKVSHWYGYGIIDGAALVNRARNWISVPQRKNCTVNMTSVVKDKEVSAGSSNRSIIIDVKSCNIVYLEHVQVITSLHIRGGMRKDISLFLTSPAGTKSTLLPFRPRDNHRDGFHLWPFMTVHSWGEQSEGQWIFSVHVQHETTVVLDSLNLILYGTSSVPVSVQAIPSHCHSQCLGGCAKRGPLFCDSCKHYRMDVTLECVEECPLEYFEKWGVCYMCPHLCSECDNEHSCSHCQPSSFLFLNGTCHNSCPNDMFASFNHTCIPCHQYCSSCNGPHNTSCTDCHPQFMLQDSKCIMRDATSCLKDEYFDHRSHECRPCHRSCASCSGKESTLCTSCYEGSHVSQEGMCVDSRQLRGCDDGQYFDTSHLKCISCPMDCASCADNLTCTSCRDTSYLTKDGFCVESCPPHTISDDENFLCLDTACHNSCLTCTDVSSHCLSCPPEMKLIDHRCVEVCPGGSYSHSGSCLTRCPPYYFPHLASKSCEPCSLNCAVCHDSSSCQSCKEGFVYYAPSQSCQPDCPAGYYPSQTGTCVSCQSPCSSCTGTSLNCSTCLSGMALNLASQQCIECCNPDKSILYCCDCDLNDRICYLTFYNVTNAPPIFASNSVQPEIMAIIIIIVTLMVLFVIGLVVLLVLARCKKNKKKYLKVSNDIVEVDISDSDIGVYYK